MMKFTKIVKTNLFLRNPLNNFRGFTAGGPNKKEQGAGRFSEIQLFNNCVNTPVPPS